MKKQTLIICLFLLLATYVQQTAYTQNDRRLEQAQAANARAHAALDAGDEIRAIREFTEGIRLINAIIIETRDANRVTLLNRLLSNVHQARGLTYLLLGDNDNAIADLTQTIRLDSNNKDAYYRRGLTYLEKGDYDRAIADFTQTIRLDSNNEDAYFYRGNSYYHKEDYNRAIADWEATLRINTNNSNARRNIEVARRQLGQ